jgi:hypothetical protein
MHQKWKLLLPNHENNSTFTLFVGSAIINILQYLFTAKANTMGIPFYWSRYESATKYSQK